MPSDLVTPTAPVAALLDRLAALIENGPTSVPSWPPGSYVTGFTNGIAPADHFLCQTGMRIFKGNEAASARPPAVLIWNHAKAERHQKDFHKLWHIPITIRFDYDRTLPPSDLVEIADNLELLLFTDYETESAAERLSQASTTTTEGLRVRDIDDISIDDFKIDTTNGTVTTVQVVFTARHCSGLQLAEA